MKKIESCIHTRRQLSLSKLKQNICSVITQPSHCSNIHINCSNMHQPGENQEMVEEGERERKDTSQRVLKSVNRSTDFLKSYAKRFGGLLRQRDVEKTIENMEKMVFEFDDFDAYIKSGKRCTIATTSTQVKSLCKKIGSPLKPWFIEKL